MSRYHSYINSSKKILDAYDGSQPFPFHIKKQFAANKQFGSKDRKMISEICYAWLRTSHLFGRNLQDKNIIYALFLCVEAPHPLLAALQPELDEKAGLPAEEKFSFLQLKPADLFPFEKELGSINAAHFMLSFLKQPLLFLRARPGKEKTVIEKLEKNRIAYSIQEDGPIALANATKLEEIINLNKEAVIQDKNSQKVFNYPDDQPEAVEKTTVWDCCAASGGKSILLFDKLKGKMKLTVSDIRTNILHNCKKRLQEAGININHAFVADISENIHEEMENFSIIICDAPCTGSGTWGRTPEQLAFFKKEKIDEYAGLQKKIAGNVSAHLKKDGLFFYITCSVFKKENEEVVEALQKEKALNLLHAQYLPGYDEQADTMFVAVFKK